MRVSSPLLSLPIAALLACGDDLALTADERGAPGPSAARVARAAFRDSAVATSVPAAASPQSFWDAQKLIRSAHMGMEVREVARALRQVDSIAAAHDALVAGTRVNRHGANRSSAELTLRVPAARFGGAMGAVRTLGEVDSETATTDDVSKAYADLETRLAVQEQTVARLRGLLSGHAAKLSDVLDVERELSRTIAELERMKGERRYYDQRVAISTITLHIWEPSRHARVAVLGRIGEAFSRSLDVLATSISMVVYFVTFLMPWLAIAVAAWWAKGRWRGRRNMRVPAPPPSPQMP